MSTSTDNERAEVKHYPEFELTEFECDKGVRMKVECYGHSTDEKTGEVLRSHWRLYENYAGRWNIAASTGLPPYATEADARAHFN